MFESEDLMDSVILSLALVLTVILIILFFLTRLLSQNMWKPFYRTLGAMKRFDVNEGKPVTLPIEPIREFNTLNEEVHKMTNGIRKHYTNLKEFTENASHEIQTPLAIIRSKLEMLIQSENISGEDMKLIRDVYESADRMTQLNQSLLLLSKIENRQFAEKQSIDLIAIVEDKLQQLEEMISFSNISLVKHITTAPQIEMNWQLAEILVSNLINNAIRHNLSGGKLIIELTKDSLVVSNTGLPLTIPPEKLFERFQKADASASSAGLGLSIGRQICLAYNFRINYSYAEWLHTVSLSFLTFQNYYRND